MTAAPRPFEQPLVRPVAAPALYETEIRHVRSAPFRHDFTYRGQWWLVDIDHLPRFPLARFESRDHCGDPARSLRENVEDFLAEHGIDLDGGQVTMLTGARTLGHVFNPISVFWCHRRSGELAGAIAEVHNTYGGRHRYLLDLDDRGRARTAKAFYVSPFYDVSGTYRLSLPEPDAGLHITVSLHRDGEPAFVATVRGKRVPVTRAAVVRYGLRYSSLRTAALIRRQGVALWARGLPVQPRPASTEGAPVAQPVLAEPIAQPDVDERFLVDASRWPDVAALPAAGPRSKVARALFTRAVNSLPLTVETPEGVLGAGGPLLRLHRPAAFFRRVARGGLIGFGESYMAGDWDADDLPTVLTVFADRLATLIPPSLQRFRSLAVRRHPEHHEGTKDNSRRNIAAHYDLSNELFATFLDPTLVYSSALFEDLDRSAWGDLRTAQQRKIDRLLDETGVGRGSRVLEIGTGWGELAVRAAARGAHVTTLTLSAEQAALAEQRLAAAGLADRVEVKLQDYRDAVGQYDAVVSVEMIEAVGYENWPVYFRTLDRLVRPGGRVGLQAITMPDDRLEATKRTYTWIQKYIFPGGMLPSVASIERTVALHTDLAIVDRLDFGKHYEATLRLWRERFEARAAEVDAMGFDAVFRRMWTLYLAYSEAGFRSGYLDVNQFVMEKTA